MTNLIKELRTKKGITQAELARLLKVAPSTVGMYEQGRRNPDMETYKQLATIFGVSLDYLISATSVTVTLTPVTIEEQTRNEILDLYNSLTEEQQRELMEYARFKASQNKIKKGA